MTNYVCIPSTKNDDPNYRYKMPQMKLSQESRLNGVKTNITNLPDVARALRVPESAILKYFQTEVGANSEGTTIIKGQHLLADLARHLDRFILKYVCCKKCKLPEITHEVNKKNLVGICRSCGTTDNKMDVMHKAGKCLHKDIPSYYQANPEFGTKGGPGAAATQAVVQAAEEAPGPKGGKRNRGKGKKGAGPAAEVEEEVKTSEQKNKERTEKLVATGGEVNRLDAQDILLNDQSIVDACEELKTFVAEKEAEGAINCNDIVREARQLQLQLNVTPEYKVYLCMCAIFGPHRNIVKHWDTYEKVFTALVSADEDNGAKHLLQAVIQFFVHRYPEQQKYAAALCKKLYDNSVIEDTLFIKWHGKSMKLDRDSKLYDRPAESAMRPLLKEFVQWLSSADYDEEADYGEEGAEEEEKKEEVVETDAERNQREMIEAQKRAQAEALAAAKAAGAEQKKKAEEAEESKRAADAEQLEEISNAKKVTDIAVEDDFDINDI